MYINIVKIISGVILNLTSCRFSAQPLFYNLLFSSYLPTPLMFYLPPPKAVSVEKDIIELNYLKL